MRNHSYLWLIVIIGIFLFSPLLNTTERYKNCIAKEISAAERWYDKKETSQIVERANYLYDLLVVNTGIDGLLKKYDTHEIDTAKFAPNVDTPAALKPMIDQLMPYWTNMLYNLWVFLFRVAHAWSWVIYLFPLIIASTFDGLMTRKAKLASFQYTSPTVYNVSWHVIIALFAASLVYFAVSMPISVFFYPLVITIMAIMVRLLISNVQHSA